MVGVTIRLKISFVFDHKYFFDLIISLMSDIAMFYGL